MSYSAVFFDMDGTVLDTLGDLHAATNACLRQFGRPERTPDEVRRFVGNGSRRLLEQAMPDADAATIDAALAWYKPWYDAHSAVLTRPAPACRRCWSACARRACPRPSSPTSRRDRACALFALLPGA